MRLLIWKTALAFLSTFTPDGLRRAVAADDVTALATVPGVGRKMAGRVVVTWGVGTANKGLRYNFSADDGQTWNTGHTLTLLPETNIAARYYSARTIQIDDRHIGTVYLSGSTVYFLKVSVDRLTKAK